MRRDDAQGPAWALLAVSGLALLGMLLGSWQLVLYPSLVMVGVLLAMSMPRTRRTAYVVPVAVTVMLLTLFGALHLMGVDDPTGEGLFLGWDPMTAIYLFVVGPVFLVVGLLYALLDRSIEADREAVR